MDTQLGRKFLSNDRIRAVSSFYNSVIHTISSIDKNSFHHKREMTIYRAKTLN